MVGISVESAVGNDPAHDPDSEHGSIRVIGSRYHGWSTFV